MAPDPVFKVRKAAAPRDPDVELEAALLGHDVCLLAPLDLPGVEHHAGQDGPGIVHAKEPAEDLCGLADDPGKSGVPGVILPCMHLLHERASIRNLNRGIDHVGQCLGPYSCSYGLRKIQGETVDCLQRG